MSIAFRFRWVPFIATVLVVGLGISLGRWQSQRADYKAGIESAITTQSAAAPLALGGTGTARQPEEFRRVTMTGSFVPEWSVYLDNRPYNGAPGFYVVTPFRLEGQSEHILVARGWAPRHVEDRERLPSFDTPIGKTTVSGIVRSSLPRVMQLGEAQPVRPGAIVQNVEIPGFMQASGLNVRPFFVQQTSGTGDTLVRDWPKPSSGIDKHHGYAFQWYGLSLMAVIFFIVTGIRREPS
jgi:surfeit locus 1 family protein